MRHRSSVLPLMRMSGFGRRRVRRVRRYGGRKMMIQGSGRSRMRGRGFFDTLKNLGSKALGIARSIPIVSTGLKLAGQDKYSDMAKSIGLGRRRRRVRRTRRYGGRRMRGRGFFDTLKNLGSKALGIARSIPIVSTGLKLAGQDKYSDMAKSIGLGRRRRVRRTKRYGGRMSVYGGRKRRVRRGGRRRATKRRFSLFGGRRVRRRRTRKYGGRKRKPMRGGFIGSLLSGLLGGRRKRRTRRVGGRKRTYRIGLFNRRR